MSKVIFALGGGSFGEPKGTYKNGNLPTGQTHYPVNTTEVDKLILHAVNKENPKILLILTASEDGQHDLPLYLGAFKKQYEGLGAAVDTLYLVTKKASLEEVKSKIANADAIYVSGGNSALMMRTWRRLGVDELLRRAYENGTVMSGLSAGSICWFKYGCSNSFYTNKPFRLTAMGWLDGIICPHYDTESFRQEPLKKMLKRTPNTVGLAVDEHAAIEVKDKTYRVHSFGSGGKVRRCYWQGGKYKVEDVVVSGEYQELNSLLNLA
jgi:dipeptidase E